MRSNKKVYQICQFWKSDRAEKPGGLCVNLEVLMWWFSLWVSKPRGFLRNLEVLLLKVKPDKFICSLEVTNLEVFTNTRGFIKIAKLFVLRQNTNLEVWMKTSRFSFSHKLICSLDGEAWRFCKILEVLSYFRNS